MALRGWLFLALTTSAAAAQPAAAISGVVREAGTGAPAHGFVSLNASGVTSVAAIGADGSYTFKGVPAGSLIVTAKLENGRDISGAASRTVSVSAGQQLTAFDLYVPVWGAISGTVYDAGKHALAGISVALQQTEYVAGALHYSRLRTTVTDAAGHYELRAESGRTYFVEAWPRRLAAESPIAIDPKQRDPELQHTYYPGVVPVESAAPLVLGVGESRGLVDIRMLPAPTYCVDGRIQTSGQLTRPLTYTILQEDSSGGVLRTVGGGNAAKDGTFRECHLFPGTYRMLTQVTTAEHKPLASLSLLTIRNDDIHNVSPQLQPNSPVPIQFAWEGDPVESSKQPWTVALNDLDVGAIWRVQATTARAAWFPTLALSAYQVEVAGLPDFCYMKDVLVGGVSRVAGPVLLMNDVAAGSAIRILVASDGGMLGGAVADKDGNPQGDAHVYILPSDAATPARVSAAMVTASSDQNGMFHSPTLPPGKYRALATYTAYSPTVDDIGRLLRAAADAQEVEVRPHAVVQAVLHFTP